MYDGLLKLVKRMAEENGRYEKNLWIKMLITLTVTVIALKSYAAKSLAIFRSFFYNKIFQAISWFITAYVWNIPSLVHVSCLMAALTDNFKCFRSQLWFIQKKNNNPGQEQRPLKNNIRRKMWKYWIVYENLQSSCLSEEKLRFIRSYYITSAKVCQTPYKHRNLLMPEEKSRFFIDRRW